MSKRSSTKHPTRPGSAITMGLDTGYGVVKAVTAEQVVTFPSVMGHAREMKFQQDEIARRHPGDQLTDNEGDWLWSQRTKTHWSMSATAFTRSSNNSRTGVCVPTLVNSSTA